MRVAAEVAGELLHVAGFAGEIELAADDAAKLGHGAHGPIRHELRNPLGKLREAGQDVEIDFHPAADARVLHFDDDVGAGGEAGAVDLTDRGRGERRRIEIVERFFERVTQFGLNRFANGGGIVGRHAGLQLLQFFGQRHADLVGPRAEDLARA